MQHDYTWVKIDTGDIALLKIDEHGKIEQNVLDKNRHGDMVLF